MKPETKNKIIIASITIIVSIIAFSIFTWPKISIVKPNGELGPKDLIQVNTGPLTVVKSISVEKDNSPVDIYINPEGAIKINNYSYDSEYTLYAYAESRNPFLRILSIEGKDIKTIRTWTTPKIENISQNKGILLNVFTIKFTRPMSSKETHFEIDGSNISAKWTTPKIATIQTLMGPGSYYLSIKGNDFEDHPYIENKGIDFSVSLPGNTLINPVVERADNSIGIVFPTNKVLVGTGLNFNNEGYNIKEIGGKTKNGIYGEVGPEGLSGTAPFTGTFPISYLTGLAAIGQIGNENAFQLEQGEYISGTGTLKVGINDDIVNDNSGNMYLVLEK